MTLEEALGTAIDYEIHIRDLYLEAVEAVNDPAGKRILEMLAADEDGHVAYLESQLKTWKETGQMSVEGLVRSLPSSDEIREHVHGLRPEMVRESLGDDKQLLSRALALEVETSEFYRKMARTMEGPAKDLFARFQEIEDGHIAAVQAELDYLSQTGFWFDFPEFDME
ncbi:MAG: ferritin family protein [Desulfobacterales bacterium]|nr:ferritin family protein [Desulfobacterales bacterium]